MSAGHLTDSIVSPVANDCCVCEALHLTGFSTLSVLTAEDSGI